ncbi:succinylglutamate desuccinylase/aspartoacylase family protein [Candidatus Uhrbacteria bacterium]|nr:succinylglutamate desuccinylase/aspartoacylase family protein [Candidatus Uhrbacteria bacterium]
MSKPFLFIACTHGDEPIGKEVVERMSRDHRYVEAFDHIIGNPRALREKKRFTDVDLNRSAPGKLFSFAYEVRRALQIMRKARSYPFVVDLHQTFANDRVVVIVTRVTRENLAFALAFPIDTILLWPTSQPERQTGSLVSYVPCGVEIESGVKTNFSKTRDRLQAILEIFLSEHRSLYPDVSALDQDELGRRSIYLVHKRIQESDLTPEPLQDFEPYEGARDSFVPLLFGRHAGLLGYKMRRLDVSEALTLPSH